MEKIALFGGSFNPIHNGHINFIKQMDKHFSFDKVLVTPSFIPPHKSDAEMAEGFHRKNMCALALLNLGEKYSVCEIELQAQEKSYTINTLKKLKSIYPGAMLFLCIGGDMLLCFDKWYKYEEILSICVVAAAARNKDELSSLKKKAESIKLRHLNADIRVVETSVVEMSSSFIRERIKNGEDISPFVDSKVCEYIKQNNLYV